MKVRAENIFLTKVCVLLCAIILCQAVEIALAQDVAVEIRYDINKGKHNDSRLVITKDGALLKSISPAKSRITEQLQFGHDYLLTFEKPGYITKRITISTKNVPKEIQEDELDFDFAVEIFQQYEGVNTVVFNQPVARYFYDPKEDGFAYDTDYTKSIRSALSAFEKEYEQQQQIQLVQSVEINDSLKQEAEAKAAQEEQQRRAAELKASEEIRRQAEAKIAEQERIDQLKKVDEQRRSEELRIAEEARKAIEVKAAEDKRQMELQEGEARRIAEATKGEEEARNAAEMKRAEDKRLAEMRSEQEQREAATLKAELDALAAAKAKLDEEKRKTDMLRAEEDRIRAAGVRSENDARKAAEAKAFDEQQRSVAAKREEEERQRSLKAKADADARTALAAKMANEQRLREEKAKADIEQRKLNLAASSSYTDRNQKSAIRSDSQPRPLVPKEVGRVLSRKESVFREGNKEITEIVIERERQSFAYRKVKHDWGGIFYFKDDANITKHDFELESGHDK